MSEWLFDACLSTPEIDAVFSARAVTAAMLRFEAALARASAAEGVIPAAAAEAIGSCCDGLVLDHDALIADGRRAGSLAIPLVKALTDAVATLDANAADYVHWGSTSQDVIDTALALVTRDALTLIDAELERLIDRLLALGTQRAATPVLARTLLQPAQVTSLGLKFANWGAPLARSRARLRIQAASSLALQLGGAVGTFGALGTIGERAPQIARRVADELALALPASPWHTQRDEWVRLTLELAVLAGNLGKIAIDLALMAQSEVGEFAEPAGDGRGSSSAMPHKRNPVGAMTALANAQRAPQRAATLLATMHQQHERGLGNWQAELAEWPGLFAGAHGALHALAEAFDGLHVDAARMRVNIEAQRGLVFSEAAVLLLAPIIGRARAQASVAALAQQAVVEKLALSDLVQAHVAGDAALARAVDAHQLRVCFDIDHAARPAAALARERLAQLRTDAQALPAAPWLQPRQATR